MLKLLRFTQYDMSNLFGVVGASRGSLVVLQITIYIQG